MSYQSFGFLAFSAAVVLLYYILPKKLQKFVILAANLAFYYFAGLKYFPYLAATLLVTYFCGRGIGRIYEKEKALLAECSVPAEKKQVKAQSKSKAKRILALSMIVVLGLLIVCKYTMFVLDNVGNFVDLSALDGFRMIVPIGISFYTFMAVGYMLDVFWKRYEAEKSFLNYALFQTYFPHIVQGPIGRYNRFIAQLPAEGVAFDATNVAHGAELALWGLFKKLVIADRLNLFVSEIYGNYQNLSGLILFIATALYSIQIYADFSGCIDIISGVSQALGINLTKNFNHPYFSKTVSEFWRRWHISLGEWFTDYIYYPVSVSKLVKKVKKNSKSKRFSELFAACLPIFVVWLITGIWHGADWKFVAWGLYYAVIMIVSVICEPLMEKAKKLLGVNDQLFSWKLFQMVRTFVICTFGRVFFRADGIHQAMEFFERMFSGLHTKYILEDNLFTYGLDNKNFNFALVSIGVLWIVDLLQEKFSVRQELQKQGTIFRWIIILAGIFAVLIFGVYGPGYDASSFIYEQF